MTVIRTPVLRASLATLSFAAILFANFVPATAANLQNMAMSTGTCERLVVDGRDFTSGCAGKIIQSIYDDGRTGWYLMVGDKGTVVTLSGMSGAKPDADSQIQDLDSLILNLGVKNAPSSKEAISGQCLYSNPNNGPTSITCVAKNNQAAVSVLEFRTDGRPPQFMNKK
jgi:hypothetical protein